MTYSVLAQNYAVSSENRIHSDDIAKKYGFKGGLVPGVTVYGYLVHPLVEALGIDWLTQSIADVRLLKPTYDGERVRVEIEEEAGAYTVSSYDDDGLLQAVLKSTSGPLPQPEDATLFEGPIKHPSRVEISWDTVVEKQVFAPWTITLTPEENARYVSEAKDSGAIYDDAVHPHYLLSLANTALTNEYAMPTWMHVGSETRHRALMRVGDTVTVQSVTLDKWRKKGHEFIRTYVQLLRDGELTTDMLHTAIFKVAE